MTAVKWRCDGFMKRRDFFSQVGTLALFSLGSLSVVEAMQLPDVSTEGQKPLNKPQYIGAMTKKAGICPPGTITCDEGGDCQPGTIICNIGEC